MWLISWFTKFGKAFSLITKCFSVVRNQIGHVQVTYTFGCRRWFRSSSRKLLEDIFLHLLGDKFHIFWPYAFVIFPEICNHRYREKLPHQVQVFLNLVNQEIDTGKKLVHLTRWWFRCKKMSSGLSYYLIWISSGDSMKRYLGYCLFVSLLQRNTCWFIWCLVCMLTND